MQDRVNDKTSMPKLSRAWIAWIGAALVIVAGGTVYMTRQAQQSQHAQQAAYTPLEIKTVTALGRLEPQGDIIKLGAATSSQENRISQLLVKEGDRVKAGQIIAILASRDRLQATRKQLDRDVQVAQTKLAQVKAGAKQGEKGAQQAEIDRFKQQLREEAATNRATLRRLKEQLIFEPQAQGAKIQALAAQLAGEKPTYRSRVSRLTAQLRNATVECQRYNTLFNQQVIEASRRDSKCLEPETLQQQLAEAKAQYQQSISVIEQQIAENTATKQRMVSNLTQQISETEANYHKTIATLQGQIKESTAKLAKISEVRSVDVAVVQAELDRAISAIQQAEVNLEQAYVRAPQAGVVMDIYTHAGELISSNGIVEIGQTDRMYAIAEVYQSDIQKIRVGQSARCTTEALAGELGGVVERIARKVRRQTVINTDPSKNIDERTIEVHVRLDKASSQIAANYTNLQVQVEISQ